MPDSFDGEHKGTGKVFAAVCGWDPVGSGGWHWLEVPALAGGANSDWEFCL